MLAALTRQIESRHSEFVQIAAPTVLRLCDALRLVVQLVAKLTSITMTRRPAGIQSLYFHGDSAALMLQRRTHSTTSSTARIMVRPRSPLVAALTSITMTPRPTGIQSLHSHGNRLQPCFSDERLIAQFLRQLASWCASCLHCRQRALEVLQELPALCRSCTPPGFRAKHLQTPLLIKAPHWSRRLVVPFLLAPCHVGECLQRSHGR